jgi:phosphatidylglycerophosphate synthase
MFDEPFRARFGPFVRPVARLLARRGVTPDAVTIAAFVLGIGAAVLLASGRTYAALALWLVSRIGDGLDGTLAREIQRSTPFGGYLDITLDMAAYAAMTVGFATLHPHLHAAWLMVLVGYIVVITTTLALSNAAGVLGREVSGTNRTFQFTPGFAEAGETNVMYVLWVLFPQQVPTLVWIWVAVLIATSIQRTHLAWRALRG